MLRTIPLCLTVTSLLLAWGSTTAQTPTLYVGGYGGSTEMLFKEKIIPPFEARTHSKVVYVPGNSTDTVAKLQAQKGKQELSVALVDDGPMYQAIGLGLCTKIADSPVLKDVYEIARLGENAVGMGFVATGLAYNKQVFQKNGWPAPTSWNDLANPKYQKKVVIPPIANGYGLLALVMMARIGGGGEARIDPGFDTFISQIAPNVLAFEASPGKMAEMLQTGEAALAVWGSGRVQAVIDQGAPVEFVYPKEGAVALLMAACPVAGAPQAELAQEFIRHILHPEIQAMLAAGQGAGPVNRKTELSKAVADKVPFGPERVGKLVAVDYKIINAKRPEWTQRWNRTVER
jgi:putative spermidine/putrescine transport system substrate-binding protein